MVAVYRRTWNSAERFRLYPNPAIDTCIIIFIAVGSFEKAEEKHSVHSCYAWKSRSTRKVCQVRLFSIHRPAVRSHVHLYIKYTPHSQPPSPKPPENARLKRNNSNENPPLALNRQLNKNTPATTASATLTVSRVAHRHVVQSIIIIVVTAVIIRISLPARRSIPLLPQVATSSQHLGRRRRCARSDLPLVALAPFRDFGVS